MSIDQRAGKKAGPAERTQQFGLRPGDASTVRPRTKGRGDPLDRGPSRSRPRRLGEWAGSIAFVIVIAVALLVVFENKGNTTEVLVVKSAVAAGQPVTAADLKSEQIAGVSGALPVADLSRIVGQTAAVALTPGEVLIASMVTDEQVPAPGERLVGLKLDSTRAPGGLTSGDVVQVLVVPLSGGAGSTAGLDHPEVLAGAARVYEVTGSVAGDGSIEVSLLVPGSVATRVAAYGAAGRVAVVQAPLSAGH
jgi:hypothetical protein